MSYPTPPSSHSPLKRIVALLVLGIVGGGGLFWVVAGNLISTEITRWRQSQLNCTQKLAAAKKELKDSYNIDFELVTTLGDSFEVCDAKRDGGIKKDKLVLTVRSKVDNEATKTIRASIADSADKITENRVLVLINDSRDCVAWKQGKEYKLKVSYKRGETRVIRFFEDSCES